MMRTGGENIIGAISLEEASKLSIDGALAKFGTKRRGLDSDEVRRRHLIFGTNRLANHRRAVILEFFLKFTNPLVITLFVVAGVSYYFGEKLNSIIVILLAFLSVVFSFFQEYRATRNAEKLAEMVKVKVRVIRDGHEKSLNVSDLVPGDLVYLSVGDMAPADLRLISAKDLHLNQSSLNGESFPAEKDANPTEKTEAVAFDLNNIVFMGSSVAAGVGLGLVIRTGAKTEFGKLGEELAGRDAETAFEKGIKEYTWLMVRFIIILGAFIFLINAIFKGNIIDALLFSLAVAVGLTPEMLPMIVTVNLSKGAMRMAKKKVIIKRLDSIQNFGAMDVLCTDKTGTLTLDSIALIKHCDVNGKEDESVLRFAHWNSFFQTGLRNILDQAILKFERFKQSDIRKIDEIPFDFQRKMLSVIIKVDGKITLIAKGAPEEILARSTHYEVGGQIHALTTSEREKINTLFNRLGQEGFRVLAVAHKPIEKAKSFGRDDESDLIFKGFVTFLDPPKPSVAKTIKDLAEFGVELKVLTGDNEVITRHICSEVNFEIKDLISGDQIEKMNNKELEIAAKKANVFVRLTPAQKERIIKALQAGKHVVGFLGDGVNDSPALKIADVGISVDSAADIAKETAAIILLEKNLEVLCDCLLEGRKTFSNVLKYIKMGASSNLGNMISMTGASIFLPFLPMLPPQVLLNNFLYDLSQVSLPVDNVDIEDLKKPRPWDIKFIKNFMLVIGPVSSLFDFVTFGVMWYIFHASPALFRTGWFVESLCTQTLVVLIIRTSKLPFFQSRPSKFLFWTVAFISGLGLFIPYTFLARWFEFQPLPLFFFAILFVIITLYLLLVQGVKMLFIRKFGYE